MAKKFRFVSSGSFKVVLRGTRDKFIYDKMNNPIDKVKELPVELIFQNGYAETDDEVAAQLIQRTQHWGADVFWHPACIEKPEEKETAKKISNANLSRLKRQQRRVEAAREGAVAKE